MQDMIRPMIRRGARGKRRPGVGFSVGLGLAVLLAGHGVRANAESPGQAGAADTTDFGQQTASPQVRHVARWVIDSRDNHGMPFVIIDKIDATVFVFDAGGHFRSAAPALLGLARGDRTIAGIGSRQVSAIRAEDRITPAGRFLVSLDHDVHGKEILLIDYDASIALHPVVKGTPAERRAERLASATTQDNRISYGCINVPLTFYQQVVSPTFTRKVGVVYILPETSQGSEISGLYVIDANIKDAGN